MHFPCPINCTQLVFASWLPYITYLVKGTNYEAFFIFLSVSITSPLLGDTHIKTICRQLVSCHLNYSYMKLVL
jgi:hypothetical protein